MVMHAQGQRLREKFADVLKQHGGEEGEILI